MTDPSELRDKEQLILQQIDECNDDVQKITQETTLENHHVSYCFEKLEEQGLITVEKPDTMVERIVDGQKRVFQAPKEAELTEKGEQFLEHYQQEDLDEYENLSHGELVEKVHRLEDRVSELEETVKIFRKQVQRQIN